MLCMVILMPVTMIIFGRCWQKRPPRKINDLYGYRTAMSMKSQETWDFAHRYFGKLWFILGLILLPLSAAAMLFLLPTQKLTHYHGAAGSTGRKNIDDQNVDGIHQGNGGYCGRAYIADHHGIGGPH